MGCDSADLSGVFQGATDFIGVNGGAEEFGSTTQIRSGATEHVSATVKEMFGSQKQLLVVVNKVVTDVGVWQIDEPLLESLIRKQYLPQADTGINAVFEPNVIVNAHDRREIFKLIVTDLIQEIADQEKRVFFLNYEPLRVEGSRVLAKIAIRDAVTRLRGAFVQYKYAFLFICVRKDDKWVVESSLGYAQS